MTVVSPNNPIKRPTSAKRGGVSLTVVNGDGRTAWSRRFRDLIKSPTADLDGDLSEAEVSLIRRASALEVQLEQLEADWTRGDMWNSLCPRGVIPSCLALFSSTLAALLLAATPTYAEVGACPISADFGGQAETTQEETQMAGRRVEVTLKRAFVQGGMVAIECNDLLIDAAFLGITDEQFLLNYLAFYGMSPLDNGRGGIDHFSEPVPHAAATGWKKITGTVVVYSYRLFRFPAGSAMVMVAFPADSNDPGHIVRFLESVSID